MKENKQGKSSSVNAIKTVSPGTAEDARIFLIGMMGSGKSYWAKKLSKKLKCGGYDLDNVVEINEEKTIAEMFEEDGEAYFREAEAKVLRWFGQKKSFVLATGGGTPCFNDNMAWMNKNGITVWLDEPIEVLVQRLNPEKSHRPLISNLPGDALAGFLAAKRSERSPFYSQAQYIIQGPVNERNFTEIIANYA
ncbi:MAG TPA: shikimate kinase [Chitinophagaceae bacterium]|nr:shikimate kinase [Chitinophagaceae bacterium]